MPSRHKIPAGDIYHIMQDEGQRYLVLFLRLRDFTQCVGVFKENILIYCREFFSGTPDNWTAKNVLGQALFEQKVKRIKTA